MSCNSTCLTCIMYGPGNTDGNPDICLTCPSGKILMNSTCLTSCPDGYYYFSLVCSLCQSNCLTCTNYSSCLTCQSSYHYHGGKCLNNCPSKYVAVVNASSNSNCVSCPSNCFICTSSTVPSCITCDSGFYLNLGSCVSNCSGGLLPN